MADPSRTGALVRFENRNHLVGTQQGGEFTVCGVAFDASEMQGNEHLAWRPPKGDRVTCPDCIGVIKLCRAARIVGDR